MKYQIIQPGGEKCFWVRIKRWWFPFWVVQTLYSESAEPVEFQTIQAAEAYIKARYGTEPDRPKYSVFREGDVASLGF